MTDKVNKKKIKHLNLTEDFNGDHLGYLLSNNCNSVRLDLVRIVMKINEIINKIEKYE